MRRLLYFPHRLHECVTTNNSDISSRIAIGVTNIYIKEGNHGTVNFAFLKWQELERRTNIHVSCSALSRLKNALDFKKILNMFFRYFYNIEIDLLSEKIQNVNLEIKQGITNSRRHELIIDYRY